MQNLSNMPYTSKYVYSVKALSQYIENNETEHYSYIIGPYCDCVISEVLEKL